MTPQQEIKEQLIVALEKEQNSLVTKGIDVTDHIVTIAYLREAEMSVASIQSHLEKYENGLLYAAIYDYDCLVSDYLS